MGRTMYARLRTLLDDIRIETGGNITVDVLMDRFVKEIGTDLRTRKKGIELMRQLKMIEERDDRIIIR